IPFHPAEGNARAGGGHCVDREVVADVERLARAEGERAQRDLENARVGLRVPAARGGHDHLEEPREAGGGEPRALHAVDAVRDDTQPEPLAGARERGRAAGQAIAAAGELLEKDFPEAGALPWIGAEVAQQAAEALGGERSLSDRSAAVEGPELVVDPPV